MTAVPHKTRSFLFQEPLHVIDIWAIAVLEEMWVSSAMLFHKAYNGDVSTLDECVIASAPDYSFLRRNPHFNNFIPVIENLEERWYEYASLYVELDPQNYPSFAAAVISDIRPLFLNIPARSAPQISRLLDLYHKAFDEYIDYFIDIWNVYYLDFETNDKENKSWEYLQAFNSIAWRPEEIRVLGNPTEMYTASPALWLELRNVLSLEAQAAILNFLATMRLYVVDGIRHHIRLSLKNRVFHELIELFYPAGLAYVKALPMEPIYQETVPDIMASVTCPSGRHSWNFGMAWTDDIAVCDDCGASKSVQSFTVEELDEICESWG